MKRLARVVIVMTVLGILVTACGGGTTNDAEPVNAVKAAMAAMTSKQFDKMAEFACAAKKDSVASQFNPAAALAGQGIAEADVQRLLDAMTIALDNAEYGTPTISGDSASVPMRGTLSVKIDKDKVKDFVKTLLAARGLPNPSDEQLNQMLTVVASQFEQGQRIDTTVDLVKENGRWVMCPK